MALNHHNHDYDGGSPDIPLGVGDRYYAQDLARDYSFLRDVAGRLLEDIAQVLPAFISGGVVTKGTGDTLDITPAVGYVNHQVEVPDSYAALPPTKKNEDMIVRAEATQQTNRAIGRATLDGGTTNYVKLRYAETNGSSRDRAKKAGSYNYERIPSFEFVVSSVANGIHDILLATFTGSVGGAFVITQVYPLLNLPFNSIYFAPETEDINAAFIERHWMPPADTIFDLPLGANNRDGDIRLVYDAEEAGNDRGLYIWKGQSDWIYTGIQFDAFNDPIISITWDGSSSTEFDAPLNWTPNDAPEYIHDLVIADEIFQPLMDGNSTIRNLAINAAADLTIAGYRLKIRGSITEGGAGASIINSNASGVMWCAGDVTLVASGYTKGGTFHFKSDRRIVIQELTSASNDMGDVELNFYCRVKMLDNLTVDDLTIDQNCILDKNGFTLTVNGSLTNNGMIII